jgi:NTE family protein
LAHLEVDEAAEHMLHTWRSMDSKGIHRHPLRTLLAGDGPRLLLSMAGIGHGASALLDTSPLTTHSARLVDMDQLARNVADGHLDGIGVTATRMPRAGGARDRPRTMLFMHGPGLPLHKVRDPARAVDLCEGPLTADHVLASAAIPMGFPPVRIDHPPEVAGWYCDGGVRLNAPLRPAVALGARRVVVIDSMPNDPGEPLPPSPTDEPMPPLSDIAAMLLDATMGNEVAEDIRLLRTRNLMLAQAIAANAEVRHSDGTLMGVTPYIVVSPEPGQLRTLAEEVVAHKTSNPLASALNTVPYALSRALRALGNSPGYMELFSYLFFDKDYFQAQIEVGIMAADEAIANGWLE